MWAEVARGLLEGANYLIFGYFILINSSYLVLIVLAAGEFVRHLRGAMFTGADDLFRSPLSPAVSLIVPAYNEAAGIVPAVQALISLRYPRIEVVVVDDGSTDDTFDRLRDHFDLVEVPRVVPRDVPHSGAVESVHVARAAPRTLVVVRKVNGGKADSLNVGLNLASHDLVCMVDADSVLDNEALLSVVKPFADDPVRMAATGGVVRIANGCRVTAGRVVDIRMPREWLVRIQIVEYLRAFLTGRTGWSRLGGLVVISGAFGVFRRDLVVAAGGMATDTVGEDAELVVRLHRTLRRAGRDYRIVFVAEPVSWSEAPAAMRQLGTQRRRWHRGLAEILTIHRGMLFNPRYGRVGMVALPYYLVFELLAPFVELLAFVLLPVSLMLGIVNLDFAWRLAVAAYGYGMVVSLSALLLEEMSFHRYSRWSDLARGAVGVVLENVGYRQVLAYYQAQGAWWAWRGKKATWGTQQRAGFGSESEGA
ncbi:glycosyltransferase [Luedemannella flava]|uniref:Glycosyltransferase n=1 Tax=Luedemannella flava TaxID=349316 RepID=A0ABN2LCY4_9ACTN